MSAVIRVADVSGPAWFMRFLLDGIEIGHMYLSGPLPYRFQVFTTPVRESTRVFTEDEAEAWLLERLESLS